MQIVLASSSSRRQSMFRDFGIEHIVKVPDIEEIQLPGERPSEFVKRLAGEKALNVAAGHDRDNSVIVAADTVVVLDNRIFGKPVSRKDAVKMLTELSGRTHKVITGWAAGSRKNGWIVETCETEVTFHQLTADEIENYADTGEPFDKAGGYGIQEKGGALVKKIEGSYFNVVGLPVEQVLRALRELGALDKIFN